MPKWPNRSLPAQPQTECPPGRPEPSCGSGLHEELDGVPSSPPSVWARGPVEPSPPSVWARGPVEPSPPSAWARGQVEPSPASGEELAWAPISQDPVRLCDRRTACRTLIRTSRRPSADGDPGRGRQPGYLSTAVPPFLHRVPESARGPQPPSEVCLC